MKLYVKNLNSGPLDQSFKNRFLNLFQDRGVVENFVSLT